MAPKKVPQNSVIDLVGNWSDDLPAPVDLLAAPPKRAPRKKADLPATPQVTVPALPSDLAPTKSRAPAKPRAPRKKADLAPFHTGVPAFLSPNGGNAVQRARLGLASVTFHPIPHRAFSPAGDTLAIPTLTQAADRRDEVWRDVPEFIIVSIDPAVTHFALRIEARSRDGKTCRTEFFDVHNFDPTAKERAADASVPKAKRRKTGQSSAEGELATFSLLHLRLFSDPVRALIEKAHVVLIEHQHEFRNPMATRISGHALGLVAALLSGQSVFTAPLVLETHSKLKDDVIDVDAAVAETYRVGISAGRERVPAPEVPKLKHSHRKQFSIASAARFLENRGDLAGAALLVKPPRGTKAPKRDDLADTVCHIEAWMRLVGWT